MTYRLILEVKNVRHSLSPLPPSSFPLPSSPSPDILKTQGLAYRDISTKRGISSRKQSRVSKTCRSNQRRTGNYRLIFAERGPQRDTDRRVIPGTSALIKGHLWGGPDFQA